MAPLFRQTLCLLPALLSGLSQGWILPRDSQDIDLAITPWFEKSTIFERQDNGDCSDDISDADTPLCSTLCTPSNYACSSKSIERRLAPEVSEILRWATHNVVDNSTILKDPYESHLVARRLEKRAFRAVAQGSIQKYLPNQFNGNADPYFDAPEALVDEEDGEETDATVVRLKKLEVKPFAIGSQGLHGCTMVTIVSSQAVYMGHFWEVPSISGTSKQFKERVLNWFTGGDPAIGSGDQLDPSLFPADSTRVYIMSPRNGKQNPQSVRYRSKIPKLIDAIKGALDNQDVPVALYNYIPLEYGDEADRVQIGVNGRGMAIFQYDPKGRGKNKAGWRIFYEYRQFQDTDPAPGPESAKGIPDM